MSAGLDIAIIGAAGRFPGAANVEAFWHNLCEGRESVTFFDDEELSRAGVAESVLRRPEYVRAQAVLEGFDHFDAEFFGVPPAQAALLDPGHRVFLECAWEAFESAAYTPEGVRGHVGVYAGSSLNGYLFNVFPGKAQLDSATDLAAFLSLDKDFLATRVSYHLNLTGPSIAVQTACSTSLVAVHLACQALLGGECDLALAGGVAVHLPQGVGYLYQQGGIASPDGHCRPFDARGQGTIVGSGAGVVVLKRFEDALADRDHILCIIKGSAINNDGRQKVGFTAPSTEGQARVVRDAQAVAGVDSASIGYVEAHGTATPMGDPIELAALTEAFGSKPRPSPCVIGSVKSNIGHLDAAAGVTGLIKAALALSRRRIPGTLHFETPHPGIEWDKTPFVAAATTQPWPDALQPRRAAVSSFGLGGTNAHLVLEEAPPREARVVVPRVELIVLSARSERGLRALSEELAEHLEREPALTLPDVAYTLQTGRRAFAFRRTCVASTTEELKDSLRRHETGVAIDCVTPRPVVFLFPGQGAQVLGAGRELYREEPVFRAEVDDCRARLLPLLGFDLRSVLFPEGENEADARERLNRTSITQPALFVIEYALARLWMSFGIVPSGLLGHSVGELTAACIGGTLSRDQALSLVSARGKLMEASEPGLMLVVAAPEAEVSSWLSQGVDLAAVNAHDQCVLSGSVERIESCERALTARGITVQRLAAGRAFHSRLMDGALASFRSVVQAIPLRAPQLPWISNVTGQLISDSEACDPEYWVRHLRSTVRFADGVATLCAQRETVVLEVGPGRTLVSLVRRRLAQLKAGSEPRVVISLGAGPDGERRALLGAAGELWRAGASIELERLAGERAAFRVALPSTPFEGQRHWVDASATGIDAGVSPRSSDTGCYYYAPTWKRTTRVASSTSLGAEGQHWLIVGDGREASELTATLLRSGARVTRDLAALSSVVEPITHAVQLLDSARGGGESAELVPPDMSALMRTLELARALGRQVCRAMLFVVGSGANDVIGQESLHPELAPFIGLCRTIPREYPNVGCRFVDLDGETVVEALGVEVGAPEGETVVAHRGRHRWLPALRPLETTSAQGPSLLREGGVYVVTGGLGGFGALVSQHLARSVRAKLVLVQRRTLSPAQGELVAALEREGGEILFVRGDIGKAATVADIIEQSIERFGAIHGIVHAAGVAHGALIQQLTLDSLEAEFRAKVRGTIQVSTAFKDRGLDFVLLCSSLTALSGGLGQAAYAAANCYLDAVAEHASSTGLRSVHSVNLDRLVGVGMAARAAEQLTRLGLGHLARSGIAGSAVTEVLESLFRVAADARVVISAKPLAGLPDDELSMAAETPNPVVSTEDLESEMCSLWARAFGVPHVEAATNFYELGGESLLALQIVNRVRELFSVQLSLQDFFENPTPAALASRLRERSEQREIHREPELVARPRRATRRPTSSGGEGTD